MRIREYLKENRLIADGALGTYFEQCYPQKERMAELYNLSEPERIKEIHLSYIKSGAKLIRTNTFAANTMFLEDEKQIKEVIRAGYRIAVRAAEESEEEVFVAADIGPIHDTGFLGKEVILEEYRMICDTFLECGADVFVFETQSEFAYVKQMADYIKSKTDAFIIVQFSVDKSGYTRSGVSVESIVSMASAADEIDAYGFNCGVGALHLYQLLAKVQFPNEKYVTALPNAGYPVELRGRTVYADSKDYFVEMMGAIASLGIEILGGCCGTTPEYIAQMKEMLDEIPLSLKRIGDVDKKEKINVKSRVLKKLEQGKKPIIVELDPPFDANMNKLFSAAKILKEAEVDLITLSDSPMARSRADAGKLAAKLQREVEIPVMPHIACRDKNVIAMRSGMLGDYINDLRHFLVVTGDPVAREDKGRVTPVFDFNSIRYMEYLTHMNHEVFADDPIVFGGALNYHGANPDAIIHRMQQKVENGCRMFLTQPIYSEEDIERIAYIKERIDTKIMCGIMPLVSYKNAMFLANEMPGIKVPQEVIDRYKPDMERDAAELVGIETAVDTAYRLKDIADGYYFMTPFNRASMIAEIIARVRRNQED